VWGVPKYIGVYRRNTKKPPQKKNKVPIQGHPQREPTTIQEHRITTIHPQPKSTGLRQNAEKTLLRLPWLEQTPLASKLIEHSKFLSSFLPFGLEGETKTSWPSNFNVYKLHLCIFFFTYKKKRFMKFHVPS
jgi:hypothetical protein